MAYLFLALVAARQGFLIILEMILPHTIKAYGCRVKCLVWNTNASPSTGNSFEVSLDSTRVEDFTVRLKYRLNGVESSEGILNAFSSFEYRIGSGAFTAISGVDLTLSSGSSFNNVWSADLSGLAAIEDAVSITLRWNFRI